MSYQEPHEPEGTTQRRRTLAGFGRTEEWRIYRCHGCKRKTWAAVGWPGTLKNTRSCDEAFRCGPCRARALLTRLNTGETGGGR